MTGHELRYQNGFDCQGLWVEVEVEKELEARRPSATSRTWSPATRFAASTASCRHCKERVDKFARVQTEQSIRLGYWMDWDRTDADWAKPPGRAEVVLHDERGEQLHDLGVPQEVPPTRG